MSWLEQQGFGPFLHLETFQIPTRGKSCLAKSLPDVCLQSSCCWRWVSLHSRKLAALVPCDGWALLMNLQSPIAIEFGLSVHTTCGTPIAIVNTKTTTRTVFVQAIRTFAMVEMDISRPCRPKSIADLSISVPKVRSALIPGSTATRLASRLLAKKTLVATTRCTFLE